MKTKGIYFLYRAIQAFALPALLLYFLYRGVRNVRYWRSLGERFGFLPHSFKQTSPGAIWLHAVSVGEVLACVEFARLLRGRFPHAPLFVSTSTIAGHATATQKLQGIAAGVFFAPADYVFAVRRVLRALRPSVVIIAETELWPNLFRETKRVGAGLLLVNGRISDRAYPRYAPFRWFFDAVLPAVDRFLVQSAEMRDRFIALGAPPKPVEVGGNFKYDFDPRPAPPDSPVVRFLEAMAPAKTWIAASTTAEDVDEDDIVIAAFRELAAAERALLLILAPRKPERFDVVARKLQSAGLPYTRRTSLPDAPPPLPNVLLLDSIGELSGLFARATVVFMGGTIAQRGGHNILEPALFRKPVIIGPHMENFRAIADDFREAGAVVGIRDGSELATAVRRLLDNPLEAEALAARALACAEARRGATARAVNAVGELYGLSVPHYRPATPWLALRWPLARLWAWGGRLKQARAVRRRRALGIPVVSIGNLTMGGTGKTPCVLRVAELLVERGRKPAILTRGYGRDSHEKYLTVAPGSKTRADQTGDEVQIFIRAGVAPVGIGADRYETGRRLLRHFEVDVVLLDDGFQHVRLARDLDIVLVDAINPFGGGDVFPLGRLREPVTALERAGVVLLTRSDLTDATPAVEHAVRSLNRTAPIFRARVQPQAWVAHRNGALHPAGARPFTRAGAFCGLGNPEAFRRTLERLGVVIVDWNPFGDHHRYRPHELRHIAHTAAINHAEALITTEKDIANLCDDCDNLVAPLPLYWLKVGMAIDREAEFLNEVLRRI